MERPMNVMKPNEMTNLLDVLNAFGFLFGFKDIWISDVKFSHRFINVYKKLEYIIQLFNLLFVMSVLGSFFTQKALTEKQTTDRLVFSIIFPGALIFYYIIAHHKEEIRKLLYHLAVVLKEHHNDVDLEREMIKKMKVFSISFVGLLVAVVASHGVNALYRVVTAGENFVTIVTAWPEVHDKSTAAGVMRVIFYCWWFLFLARIMVIFVTMAIMMIAILYQFRNLQSYFFSLDDIFSDKTLSQAEKEIKYEQRFKIGIQMHSLTLWCKRQHQKVSKELFAAKIILFFGMLLTQLWTLLGGERSLTQLSLILASVVTCIALGILMWNGGHITIEASKLSEAMYSSGWQNCYGQSSVRIRKLVVNAMRQAQVPVVYKTLGFVEFSYESYVTVVKMPYTAVSMFF